MDHRRLVPIALTASMALVLVGCGADSPGMLHLSPAAAAGRELSRTKGCAACHGLDGQGGVGPKLAGTFGSTVALEGGATVTVDRAYVVESIRNPSAKTTAGYSITMPETELSDAEVASLVAFISELRTP
jgi:cytochrome c oxidase subunit 2